MTMKLLLDNLFLLGQVVSLAGVVWGAWLVLREAPGRHFRASRRQKIHLNHVVHG
jgi:hypothetical protein